MGAPGATTLPDPEPTLSASALEFRVLGPLGVAAAGRPLSLGGRKQRLVLALLLLEANRVVSVDRLIDRVWGDEPPEAARSTIQAYVSRLRKVLGPGRIEARSPGYVLLAAPEEVDAEQFERLTADAHRRVESDPQAAKALLDRALDLWRGPALDDLEAEPGLRAQLTRLEELRLAAMEDRVEARLALGHHAELTPELERLVADHPLQERLWAALVLALYRSGRQAEALAAFQRARRILDDELGIDPSPELQRLQERILNHDPALQLRGRRLRGYELVERIGEGSTGTVYRAIQPIVRRDVAVKIIHRRLANDPEFVRRFEQEAHIVARLEHPHIVPLYDYWREPDGAYLVMRYLRGGSLKDRLEAKGPLSTEEAGQLVDQVASALDAAHRQNVVHRDVRPANILFDEDGNAYLSDFGIATEVAVAGALTRRRGGLSYYLAPEEVGGEPISAASDVYSLGLVLYAALAGRHPVGDESPSEILDRQSKAPTLRIDNIRPDLPDAVGEVIVRATNRDPTARYPDASSLALAFRAALEGGPVRPAAVAPVEVRNPYKGLRPFDEADAADFFGRDQLTLQLVARLSEPAPASRFLAVVGPSGSGKSSAIRAGLLPAIRRGDVPRSDRWFVVQMHPGVQPFQELETALLRVAVTHPPSLIEELERDDRGLLRAVDWILPKDDSELLIVIDQFEELFPLGEDEERRDAFLRTLVSVVSDPVSRLRVVVTLRADFYDRPLLHPGFGELLAARTQAVAPMRSGELERAITAPAERVGVSLEPRLLAEILMDVAHQPGNLPLLQYAMTELFQNRTDATLTAAAYRAVGGVGGALAGRAEELYRRLDEAGREVVRQLFLRLAILGEAGSEDRRRRVLRTELAALDVDQQAMDGAIQSFGEHRFLSFDRDPVTRGPTVELAHEVLLRSWPRLQGWIDSGRQDLRTYRRLSAEAAEWNAAGRDPSFLLRGSRLEQFESWAAGTDIALSQVEHEYVDASLRARDADVAEQGAQRQREASLKRRSVYRLRALVAVLTAGVLVAGSLAWVAEDRQRQAERESRIATSRELAAAAVSNLDVDTERSLLLALEAAKATRSVDGTVLSDAEEALHAALQAHRLVLTVPGYRGQFSADGNRLLVVGPQPGEADVYDAGTGALISNQIGEGRSQRDFRSAQLVFTPDGTRFATTAPTHNVAVYVTATGEELWHAGTCCSDLAITPDGRFLLIGLGGDVTGLVDLKTGEQVNSFPGMGGWAFSPDGKRALLTTGDWDPDLGTFVTGYVGDLHEPGGGTHILTLLGEGDIGGAAWGPDGSIVATSSPDNVVIWDSHTGERRFTFAPPAARFMTLNFGQGPGLLATAMSDDTTIVWRLASDRADPILRLAGHDAEIRSVGFNPDGSRLVTASDDGKVKVWDVTAEGGGESVTVRGTGGLDYSEDGRLLAVGSDDGHVDEYEAATGRRVVDIAAHTKKVDVIAFGRGGSRVATASLDGIVNLSDAASGGNVWTVRRVHGGDVATSPDGTTVATPGDAGTIRLVDATTSKLVGSLDSGDGELRPDLVGQSLAFSPSGKFLAGGGGFPFVYIWNVGDRSRLSLRQPFVESLAFSPDGRRLATAGFSEGSGSVRVWDTQTGQQLASLKRLAQVTGLAFSPDGSRIATSSRDGTLRLWDAATFEQLLTLATDANGRLAYNPDGTRLAYEAEGEVVRVLALPAEDLIKLAQARLGRSLTEEECQQYLYVDHCASPSR
jgi:serine/threonine protein kinase/WD40 repeat protein/DNA-binding winged helix-turn-helix (wHTH) protein